MKIFPSPVPPALSGSSVVDELLRRGHTVVGLQRAVKPPPGSSVPRGPRAHRGSIDDTASILSALDVVDGVIHTAPSTTDFSTYVQNWRCR